MIRLQRRGVTLTELLVGVAIISLALIPIISSLISGMKATTAGNMEVNAALIGSSILETALNSLRFDEVEDTMVMDPLAGVTDEDGNLSNNQVTYDGTIYRLIIKTNNIPNTEFPITFRPVRSGLFGKTDLEYAKPPMDVKSHISKNWKNFKPMKLFLTSFREPDPSLKEIFLEIHWMDPKGLERVYNFYTRKARLD